MYLSIVCEQIFHWVKVMVAGAYRKIWKMD